MTFEQLRITYQSDEQMARALFAQVVQLQAMLALTAAQRDKFKNKLAPPPARRTHRGEK
ncbi:hypothetical protein [Massilia timonae]|uniref:hypothetical protein n=1 Tax=Massilia timonae TaxID=47229 RepID=UPI0028D4FBCE|nr:hypothetical protein [Massilia timonae]